MQSLVDLIRALIYVYMRLYTSSSTIYKFYTLIFIKLFSNPFQITNVIKQVLKYISLILTRKATFK